MKTTKALCVSILMTFSLIVQPLNAETVKGTGGKKSAGKGDAFEMTDQDKANGAAKSPYKACAGMMMVESSNSGKDHWVKRAKTCDTGTSNCAMRMQTIPDTGMFKKFSGKASGAGAAGANMSSAVTAVAFLEGIRKDAEQMLTKSLADKRKFRADCFGGSPAATCSAGIESITKRVGEQMPAFRKAIARLNEPTNDVLMKTIITGDVSGLINDRLAGVVAVKSPKMEKLSATEFAEIKKSYEKILADAKLQWEKEVDATITKRGQTGRDAVDAKARLMKPENFMSKLRALIAEDRGKALLDYDKAIAVVPEIRYLGDPKAAKPEIAKSVDSVVADGQEALEAIKKQPLPENQLSTDKMDSSLLRYAAFTQLIEKKLEQEQKEGKASSCAVATAVFNELQAVRGQRQMFILGATFASMATLGLGSMGVFGAGVATYTSGTALWAGIVGGALSFEADRLDAVAQVRDAKADLVKVEEAREAVTSAGLGAVFAPLDWIGAGPAVIAAGALAAKGVKLAGKNVGKFAVSAVEKGAIKGATTSPAEIRQLATTAGKSESVTDANKIGLVVDQEARGLLKGRTPTVDDDEAFDGMAKAGFLGDQKNPVVDPAREYAELTKDMTVARRKEYADSLEALTRAARGSDAVVTQSADRAKVAGQIAVQAAVDKELVGLAPILHPKSGWSVPSLAAVLEVVKSAGRLAKGTAQAGSDAVGTRLRKALAKINKKGVDSPDNVRLCGCLVGAQTCAIKGASLDRAPASEEPQKLVACVANPENFATN